MFRSRIKVHFRIIFVSVAASRKSNDLHSSCIASANEVLLWYFGSLVLLTVCSKMKTNEQFVKLNFFEKKWTYKNVFDWRNCCLPLNPKCKNKNLICLVFYTLCFIQ